MMFVEGLTLTSPYAFHSWGGGPLPIEVGFLLLMWRYFTYVALGGLLYSLDKPRRKRVK
jgi:hypothetical protein